jgi:hypothetical protein
MSSSEAGVSHYSGLPLRGPGTCHIVTRFSPSFCFFISKMPCIGIIIQDDYLYCQACFLGNNVVSVIEHGL